MPDVMSNDDLNVLAAEYVLGTLDYEERKGASALLEVDHAFRGMVRIWEKRFGELHLMVESVEPDPKVWERIRPKIVGLEQVPLAIPSAPAEGETPEPSAAAAETSAPTVGETSPGEPAVVATAEAELKLAELAALLPAEQRAVTEQPAPDDPQARAAEQIQRGFVPPAPMVPRSTPPAPETVAVRKSGRGWMAASLLMGLIAVVLGGLISAWRFFPERLPDPLRAYTVLNIPLPPPPAMAAPPPPPPPPFDE